MNLTRGEQNIAWIEKHCFVPEGTLVGQKVKLRPFQRDIILGIYGNVDGTRRAIISFGRKNAKTSLAAFLVLLHLVGPEAKPNSQLFSSALSRDQASILFALASKCVRMSAELSAYVDVKETAKQLVCKELGTVYRALSADASTSYGLSPVFVVHDELGQVKGPRSELYEALETASGAQTEPMSIVISTQAPTDADLLSVLIDDAVTGVDPKTILFMYSAPTELDPFSEEAIAAANPAFYEFMNQSEIRQMAETARRMPSREAAFRNLVLNQRIEARDVFVPRSVWESNGAPPMGDLRDAKVWGGLDLSSVADLTALVLVAPFGNGFDIHSNFWLPNKGLAEKSRADRVPYDKWKEQGHLMTSPGASIEYEFVAEHLRGLFDRCDVQAIAFDRYNMKFLKPWLEKASFSENEMAKFIEFGQGYMSMSPAIRELEAKLLAHKLRHGNHPILAMCAHNATVMTDPAENRKFVKARSTGRIDGIVALAMAIGVMPAEAAEAGPEFQAFSL